MKTCRDCRHFVFTVNPETKRRLPSMPGRCIYPVPWPDKWPDVYRQTNGYRDPERPFAANPYPGRCADRCVCFEAVVDGGKRTGQMEIRAALNRVIEGVLK